MNKYLLLRDNKQSGPYTVPEIIAKGIKPYDLVWLEGKSAAWRYPSEIEELKAYAPAVEEQPFDRFYKKPEKTPLAPAQQLQEADTATEDYKKFEPKEPAPPTIPEKYAAKVYINFPGNKQQTETFTRRPAAAAATEKISDITEPAPKLEPMNVGSASVESQQSDARQEFTTAYNTTDRKLLYGVIVACFFLVMFIGIMLVNYSRQRQNIDQLNSIVQQMESDDNQQAAMTVPIPDPEPTDFKEEPTNVTNAEINETPKQSVVKKNAPVTRKPASSSAVVFKETTHVNENHAPLAETEKPQVSAPANLYELISVKPNQYKTGVLGGISNLQFELTNNSNVPLHRVALEVRYLGPEKKVVKKQTVYFESVAAGAQTTINVPKSNRGVSIEYTITDVKSQVTD
jgi:hypothetical protein